MSIWSRRARARQRDKLERRDAEPPATAPLPAAAELRRWRERHRYSRAQLADALGVHPRTVRRWENGKTRVPAWLAHALVGVEAADDA